MKERPSIGEWLNKLWYMVVMEYYCAEGNNEWEKVYADWEKTQGIDAEFKQLFFFCVSAPTVLPLDVGSFFFISPSVLFWVFALQLLVKKTITFRFTTVYQPLYT